MALVRYVAKLVHITGVLGHLMVTIRQMVILILVLFVLNLKLMTTYGMVTMDINAQYVMKLVTYVTRVEVEELIHQMV